MVWVNGSELATADLDLRTHRGGEGLVRDQSGNVWWDQRSRPPPPYPVLNVTSPGKRIVSVTLTREGAIRELLPAREGGVWVLLDASDGRWLARLPGAPAQEWVEVPPGTRWPLTFTEPAAGELWIQERRDSEVELVRLRDGAWTRFRLASVLTREEDWSAKELKRSRIRAVLPWLEKRRPFNLMAIYLGFLLGAWRAGGSKQVAFKPLAGALGAGAAAIVAWAVIAPLLELGSGWSLPSASMMFSLDFVEWFFARVALAVVAAAFAAMVVGRGAPAPRLLFGAVCASVLVIASLLARARGWHGEVVVVLAVAPLLVGEVLHWSRRAQGPSA